MTCAKLQYIICIDGYTAAIGERRMQRKQRSGLVDVAMVADPDEVRAVLANEYIDREYAGRRLPLNRLLLRRITGTLSYRGTRFPTLQPRNDPDRKARQAALWDRLNAAAATFTAMNPDLDPLAHWVRGTGGDDALGPLVQGMVGKQFDPAFLATKETWAAAELLEEAVRTRSLTRRLGWALTGKVRRAKARLGPMVNDERAGIHGVAIALHNLVKGFRQMRILYAAGDRHSLPAPDAASQCLFAPTAVLRQPTQDTEVAGCPLSRNTIVVLALGEAAKRDGTSAFVFLKDQWSQCPADTWVPALLEGVWSRACSRT